MGEPGSDILANLERDGYAIVRGLLGRVETASLRSALGGVRDLRTVPGESIAADKSVQYALSRHPASRRLLRRLTVHRAILPVLRALHENPFVEHTKVLPKLAHAPATPWHQDAAFWAAIDPKHTMVTLWVPLADVTKETGCMRVARQKKGDGVLAHTYVPERQEYVLPDGVAAEHFTTHEIVDVELEEGDGLLFHCKTVHGAWANSTDSPRLAFKLVFQDYSARAPAKPLHVTSMEVGFTVADDTRKLDEYAAASPVPVRRLVRDALRSTKAGARVAEVLRRLRKPARTASAATYTDVFPRLRQLQLRGTEREWRMVLYLAEIIDLLEDVPGDIAEFGVAGGVSLLTMLRILRIREHGREGRARRTLYGFDSFEGLPSLSREDVSDYVNNAQMKAGGFFDPASQADLFQQAEADGGVRLVKGWFHETLPQFIAEAPHVTFALVHVDCDLFESTEVVLRHVWDRVAPGGIVLFDELFDKDFPGETVAFRKWAPGKSFVMKTSKVRREMKYLVKVQP